MLLLAAGSSAAVAQTSFPARIASSCGAGTTYYEQDALVTSPTSTSVTQANFGATPLGSCDHDLLFTHAVFWRLASDVRTSQFYDTQVAGDQGGISHQVNGDNWTVRWPDVDNRGLLDATWRATAVCGGDLCGRTVHEWTLRNVGASAETFELYAYTDFDISLFSRNQTLPATTGPRQIVQLDPAFINPCTALAEFYGETATAWEIAAFPTVSDKLTGAAFTPLAGATLPFGPSDYTGALGWNLTLQPNETVTVVYSHGHNCLACSTQAQVGRHGSAFGPVTIGTVDVPTPGCEVTIDMTGPANTAATLLAGGPANTQLPGCPQTLLVQPAASVTGMFDAAGVFTLSLEPSLTPTFCGVPVYFQVFSLVQGPPCIPLQHSDALVLNFGNP